jgi:hypothetical protein
VATAAVNGFNARHTNVKVSVDFCDSKSSPNATLACAVKARRGGYDALVIGNSFLDFILTKATSAAGIPTIAGAVNDPQTWNNKTVYCLTSTLLGQLHGLGAVAKGIGVKKVSTVTFSGPVQTQAFLAYSKQGFEGSGVAYGGAVQVPLSTTDWAPAITQAMASKPDGLSLVPFPGPSAIGVFKTAKQVAPSAKFVEPSFEINAQLAAVPAVNGAAVSSWVQPPQTSGVRGTKLFQSDISKWGNPSQELSEPYEITWLAIQLAGNLASRINGAVTPQSMMAALSSATNVDMYGITPPYNGPARGVNGQKCVWNGTVVRAQIKDGKLVADTPGQFVNLASGKTLSVK